MASLRESTSAPAAFAFALHGLRQMDGVEHARQLAGTFAQITDADGLLGRPPSFARAL
jgi:hypothetical protein